jgi:uncharacterized protein
MVIEEKFVVKTSIQKVWDFLMNPEELSSCIPGCEKMETIGERNYLSVVKVRVGPLSAKFAFNTEITELEPPFHLKSVGKGEDKRRMGNFRHETVVDFKEVSINETEISYRSDIDVVGKLATFGERVMRGKAKQLGQDFVSSVKKKLEGHNE